MEFLKNELLPFLLISKTQITIHLYLFSLKIFWKNEEVNGKQNKSVLRAVLKNIHSSLYDKKHIF